MTREGSDELQTIQPILFIFGIMIYAGPKFSIVPSTTHIGHLKVTDIRASSRENLSSGFPPKRVSNQSPQLQRLARKFKFHL